MIIHETWPDSNWRLGLRDRVTIIFLNDFSIDFFWKWTGLLLLEYPSSLKVSLLIQYASEVEWWCTWWQHFHSIIYNDYNLWLTHQNSPPLFTLLIFILIDHWDPKLMTTISRRVWFSLILNSYAEIFDHLINSTINFHDKNTHHFL